MNHTSHPCCATVQINGHMVGTVTVPGHGFIAITDVEGDKPLVFSPAPADPDTGLVEVWFTDKLGSTVHIYQRLVDYLSPQALNRLLRIPAVPDGAYAVTH